MRSAILRNIVIGIVIGRGSAVAVSHTPQHHLGLASLWERVDRIILPVGITDPINAMPIVVVVCLNLGQQGRSIRRIGSIVRKYQASSSRFSHSPTLTILILDRCRQPVWILNRVHLATIKMDLATIGKTPRLSAISLPVLGDANRRAAGIIVHVAVRRDHFMSVSPQKPRILMRPAWAQADGTQRVIL